jgi:enoyl-CoA hydratase
VSGATLGAQTIDARTALQRGWIDAVVPPEDLLSEAIATARALSTHSPFAYAATKAQLHRPARAAIDAAAELDPRVRAGWLSDETFARIADYLAGLK